MSGKIAIAYRLDAVCGLKLLKERKSRLFFLLFTIVGRPF